MFEYGGDFLIKSKDETSHDMLVDYVSKAKYANAQGIYIIFSEDMLYVGQTARSFLGRLKKHVTTAKKEELFRAGVNILFFGRIEGVGKDILDYMEKELIATLKVGGREVINENNGNTSFISNDREIYANYILERAYQTSFLTNINPFEEFEIVKIISNELPEILGEDTIKAIKKFDNFMESVNRKAINDIIKSSYEKPVFIEYVWPTSSKVYPVPIEGESNNCYYSKTRDGDFPSDFDEAKKFDEQLTDNYLDEIGGWW